MNVTVSVLGRFHAFYLAHQLYKREYLQRLITTYPKFEVKKHGIPRAKTYSLFSHELIRRGWSRLPDFLKPDINLQFWFHERFDKAACQHIPDETDVYVGWSSVSERGLLRAKELGAVTILERGSSHIEYQRDILQEEYERFGFRAQLPYPEIVEKEKREYEIADYIEVPSDFAHQSFIVQGVPAHKLIKGFRGVDLGEFRQLPKKDDVFRAVFAGAMSLQKGVHYLLQAFAELRLSDAELWLLGGKQPEIEPFFKKYEGSFRHFGHVPQNTLHEYYSQCSVFAICSIQDGFGMVIPQGMACGLPVICSVNTGGPDIIEDGREGFVVPIRDVETLKEKILYLYEHPDECYEMGQAAKQKVQAGLTWDDYGTRIISEYQRVVGRQNQAKPRT